MSTVTAPESLEPTSAPDAAPRFPHFEHPALRNLGPTPEALRQSWSRFAEDLPELLQTHRGRWAAYTPDGLIQIDDDDDPLYETCLELGLQLDQFLVCYIVPRYPLDDRASIRGR